MQSLSSFPSTQARMPHFSASHVKRAVSPSRSSSLEVHLSDSLMLTGLLNEPSAASYSVSDAGALFSLTPVRPTTTEADSTPLVQERKGIFRTLLSWPDKNRDVFFIRSAPPSPGFNIDGPDLVLPRSASTPSLHESPNKNSINFLTYITEFHTFIQTHSGNSLSKAVTEFYNSPNRKQHTRYHKAEDFLKDLLDVEFDDGYKKIVKKIKKRFNLNLLFFNEDGTPIIH